MNKLREHLIKRGVDFSKYNIIYDEKSESVHFYLYNLSQQIIGFQRYNYLKPKNHFKGELGRDTVKYYTYVTKHFFNSKDSKIACWGLDYIKFDQIYNLYVVEGIFDAISLQNENIPAIASLTSTPSPQMRQWFKSLGKNIIVICDNDDAGNKLKSIADVSFSCPSPYKDVNEMPREKLHEWINTIK